MSVHVSGGMWAPLAWRKFDLCCFYDCMKCQHGTPRSQMVETTKIQNAHIVDMKALNVTSNDNVSNEQSSGNEERDEYVGLGALN